MDLRVFVPAYTEDRLAVRQRNGNLEVYCEATVFHDFGPVLIVYRTQSRHAHRPIELYQVLRHEHPTIESPMYLSLRPFLGGPDIHLSQSHIPLGLGFALYEHSGTEHGGVWIQFGHIIPTDLTRAGYDLKHLVPVHPTEAPLFSHATVPAPR
jgi:hypothetical protein